MLTCRVSPNARKTEFTGWTMDEKGRPVLLVKLHAAPVEGAANIELLRFLADELGVGKKQVQLVRGTTNRNKVVEIPTAAVALLPPRK